MTITTEFVLHSSSLPLVSVPNSLQTDKIESTHALCLQPDVQIFSARFNHDDSISDEELLDLDEIMEAELVGKTNDKTVYRLTVKLEKSVSQAFEPDFEGVELEPTTVTTEGWHETKVFRDYENFNAFRKSCEDHGISLDLLSISPEPSSSDNQSEDGLTDRQREALTLAISRGYYESPRQVTAEELAQELGISQPSLSTLLRRGERQLIASSLDSQVPLETVSR